MDLIPLDALWISWTLQSTFGVVLLCALWGMRRVFRADTVDAIARGWLAYVVAMIGSLVAAATDRADVGQGWHIVVNAIEGASSPVSRSARAPAACARSTSCSR